MTITLVGAPRTKKNSARLITAGRSPRVLPSEAFEVYQDDCGWQLGQYKWLGIDYKANICCLYYMPTAGKVDLLNLLSATMDILTHYGVIVDDNSRIAAGHDGSRVLYDKERPRVEIKIERMEG